MAQVLIPSGQDTWEKPETTMESIPATPEFETPPGGPYGERLVVNTVDELARRTPDRIYATVSKSAQDLHDGFRDITVRQLADAVNCASWSIDNSFGRSTSFEVIAYLGVSDVRYAIYTFASIKTGHVFMVPSVRNSLPQHLAVFQDAKCNKLFYTSEMEARVKELKESVPGLQAFLVPSLDDLLSSESPHYEYNRTFVQGRTDPILIAHSSGSTGNPKPTTITNGVYSTYDNHRRVPQVPGRKVQGYTLLEFDDNGRFFCPFPPFHLAGLFGMTIMPIFYSSTVTLPPPEKPPSGELVSQAMKLAKFRGLWAPPSVIEQLAGLPGGLEQIASLDFVIYTGGPLAPAVGDVIARVTDLCQLYGSTETGPQIALIPLPENWNWFEWHPVLQNTMEPMGDGTFEMVCYKEPKWDHLLHLQQAYPQLDVWRTRDLFVQKPDNPRLWRFVGRRDDVIVLSNGEKFNPVNMEGIITGHPLVKGAIIIGTARIQACLLVEPAEGVELNDSELINELWPTIQEANAAGPAHGRIFRHKVTVGRPDKPFKRAGKGTIVRSQTALLYADEVDKLYQEGSDNDASAPQLASAKTLDEVEGYVRASAQYLLSVSHVSNNDDLFVLGLDSLQTQELAKSMNHALKRHLAESGNTNFTLQASHIYAHPTVLELAKFLFAAVQNKIEDPRTDEKQRTSDMAGLVKKYTTALQLPRKRKLCVAITGTTGSLGSYMLENLLNDDLVYRVYCLNRSDDAPKRQADTFRSRGKKIDLESKARFLTVKFGSTRFGLSETEYEQLQQDVDAFIHNAWKVDFNHKLSSFEEVHIKGVRDLVDFSLSSDRKPHLFFVSSISSMGNWGEVYGYDRPVPEAVSDNYDVSMSLGYAESKHVAERIIAAAQHSAGLNASILRVGQVAGPVDPDSGGVWNLTEWMPSLVMTSKTLKMLPDAMNTIDWIPVDTLANIVGQLVHGDCETGTSNVYNLINPHVAHWPDMLAAVQGHWAAQGHETRVVPFPEWLQALKKAGEDSPDVETLPALKIYGFFAGLAEDAEKCKSTRLRYDTTNGSRNSENMASLKALDGESMGTWMKQWNF